MVFPGEVSSLRQTACITIHFIRTPYPRAILRAYTFSHSSTFSSAKPNLLRSKHHPALAEPTSSLKLSTQINLCNGYLWLPQAPMVVLSTSSAPPNSTLLTARILPKTPPPHQQRNRPREKMKDQRGAKRTE